MDKVIDSIISKSQQLVANEKLDKGRDSSPTYKVRFSFLTTAGILRTEKTFDGMSGIQNDVGGILMASAKVLTLIVEANEKK